ncbi:MAG: matrixin family metalloprotease [Deltaproteobacteria bacterium]|nr:matrixin family metalloprotease [Deltaproteobacteria bacterium]
MSRVWLLGLPLLGFGVVKDPAASAPIVWESNVEVTIHSAGLAEITDESDVVAVRSALEAWSAPACTSFRFLDGGTDASASRSNDDGVNRVVFVESDWPGAANGATATTLRRRSGGRWVEADVLINGQDFTWSTNGDVHARDLQSIVVHELGHVLGLQHSADPESTMYFGSTNGITYARTLDEDDVAGVCFLYPAGPRACDSDADCPLLDGFYGGGDERARCEAGSCVSGAAESGRECLGDEHCASGSCARDPAGPPASDPGWCSEACGATCASGDLCREGQCWKGRDDCLTHEDCNSADRNRVCARDLDGRFRCTKLCRDDGWCVDEPGTVCHGGLGVDPPGFCRRPGTLGDGTPCRQGLECASLSCAGPGATPTCGAGATQPVVDAGLGDGAPSRDAAEPLSGDAGGSDSELRTEPAAMSPNEPLGGGCGCETSAERGAPTLIAAAVLALLKSRARSPQQ